MMFINNNWSQVKRALAEVEERKRQGLIPFTCFYRRQGKLLGSYFCGDDEEGEFVLFVDKDYSEPAVIVDLISQHCQFLNDDVRVYTLDKPGIEMYEMVHPQNFICVEI